MGGTRAVSTVQNGASVKDAFLRAGLLARGFVGFQRFKRIDLTLVPALPGVYVVLRERTHDRYSLIAVLLAGSRVKARPFR